MAVDFENFKDLPPERRMQELQKLIDSLKKEIDQRQKDIQEAEQLLSLADEEARLLEQVEIPQARPVPKRRAEGIEEKAEEKPERLAREERLELEKLLATAPPRSEELLHRVAHRPVQELYGELRKIYDRQKETGVETQQDREMVYAIRKGFEIKKEEGYAPAKKDKNLMTAAEQMAESMYQSTSGTYRRNPT